MASFGKHFLVNKENGISNPSFIKKGNFYRITVLSERLIRLEFSKDGVFNDDLTELVINRKFPFCDFDCQEDNNYIIINTKYFELQYAKEKTFLGPSFAPDSNLRVKLKNTDKVWYYGHPEARNFLATTTSLDNYKGKVQLTKGLYSTDGFVSLDDSKSFIINDMGMLTENQETNNIDIYLFMYRRDFGLCLKDYFTLTGYPLLIPRFALGIWWYRDKIYTAEDIIKLLNKFNEKEIPLNVLLLGEFWHIKDGANINLHKTGYTFNNALFPNPEELISTLHERNIYLGLNIDPSEGIRPQEPMYDEIKKDIGFKNNDNIPFNIFDKMFLISYFEKLIDPLMKTDLDFLWIDYKKDVKVIRALSHYHIKNFENNEYKRPLILTRNPGIAAHRKGILFSGETLVSWETLKYLPYFNSSASNLGISWWSHDIGGFKNGIEDSELYTRYVQFGVFNPIFRFSAKRGLYYKREPWAWDFKTYSIVKNFTKLRQKLIPYLYSENYRYAFKGIPLIQPIYYNYPQMYDEKDYKSEYYFGSSFFISPITEPEDPIMKRTIQRLFLPKGTWYDFFSGKKFSGAKRYITFYKDEDYPAFAKAGAIIPMANVDDNINILDNPEKMEIHVFPGESNSYELYEDDGKTMLYKTGFYMITSIDYSYTENNFALVITPKDGKSGVIPAKREYKILFRNTKYPEKIEVFSGGNKISENVKCELKDNNFIITIADVDTSKPLTINCNSQNIEIDAERILNEDINEIINDLVIPTNLKEKIAKIAFSDLDIKKKRIAIRKLKNSGLDLVYIKVFMKIYDYLAEI